MCSAERVQGSHISLDPFRVKFTCSPTTCVGSFPGRLFSTHSPPTCRPGGLGLCRSASKPTPLDASDLSGSFPNLPAGSLIRLCPRLKRVHTALFLLPLVQNVYFEHQGFLFFCFLVFFNSVFGFWQLCQIFLRAGLTWQQWGLEVSWNDEVDPNHLVDLEVMIKPGLPNLTVCCEPTLGHNQDWWPSKTTGAQALNLAPHTVKSGIFQGNWPENQAKKWKWNFESTWTSFCYSVCVRAAMFSICNKSSLLSLLFFFSRVWH